MAEEIDVRARLTAEDNASPTIRRLVNELSSLDKKIKANFAKTAISGNLIDDKVLKHLRNTGGELDTLTPKYMRWARSIKNANQMSAAGYTALTDKIRAHEAAFVKNGNKLSIQNRKEVRDLVRKAAAYRAVWNEMYQGRERLERRYNDVKNRIEDDSARRTQRRLQDEFRAKTRHGSFLFRLMQNSRRMEERDEGARRRERAQIRGRVVRGARSTGEHLTNARNRLDGNFMNSPAFYAMAAGTASLAAAISSFSTLIRADTSETNMKMFGGLTDAEVKDFRKSFGDKTAMNLGLSPDKFMDIGTEVLKAGIPKEAYRAVAEMIGKAATGLDMDTANATKLAGRSAALLMDQKTFDPKKIYSTLNSIAIAAKETAADPNEIVAANRRGAGALSATKMSMEELSAFTAAGISTDMPSGKVGTFMGFLTNELVGAKFARGQRAQDLQKAIGLLGMGNRSMLSKNMAESPTQTLLSMFDKMGGMDEQKRVQVANLIGMREWRDELLTFVKNRDDISRTLKAIANEPNFLDEASQIKLDSLKGRLSQVMAGLNLMWEKIGYGLKTSFVTFSNEFMDIARRFDFEFFSRHVEAAVNGFIKGFGFDTVGQMIRETFGNITGGINIRSLDSVNRFFKGAAEGFKVVGKVVGGFLMGLGSLMGIDTSTAEGMGKLAAELIGFSLALHFARPGFALLGVFKDVILAVAAGLLSLRAMGLLGLGAGMTGGGMAGMAAGLAVLARFTLIGGALAVAVMNWDKIKDAKDAVVDNWKEFWNGPSDPAKAKAIEEAKKKQKTGWDFIKEGLGELFGVKGARAGELPPGYQNPDAVRGLEKSAQKINDSFNQLGARIQLAGLTGGSGGGFGSIGGSSSIAVGGGNLIGNGAVNSFGLGRRGILGGAYSSGTPGAGLYDAIINAEGTAKGGRDPYNTVLGYGRWGSPSKNLTDMTLNEVKEHGLVMRRAQEANGMAWNKTSSASGAFQIVGSTMMDAARALGMDPSSTKFTPDVQRQMAAWIAKRQGLGAWEGFRNHPGELAKAQSAMAGGASPMTALSAGMIPVKTSSGGTAMMDPRSGIGQAFGGGKTSAGVLSVAQAVANGGIAGGLNRFTAFNDQYHAGTGSKHASGLAGDFTIKDPSKSAEAAEQLRNMIRGAGVAENMFKVIDEYKSKSGSWTGGHLHYQFNSQEAAEQFAASQKAKALAASVPSPQGMASSIPFTPPAAKSGGMFDPNFGGGNGGFNAPITIHGGNQSAEEIATSVQRRIQDAMNWRTHDIESELT